MGRRSEPPRNLGIDLNFYRDIHLQHSRQDEAIAAMSGAFYKRFVPPPNSSTKNASPASSAALNSRSKHATDAFNASAHPTKRKDDTKKGRSKQNNPVQRDTDDIVDRGTSHRSTESPVASRKAKKRKRESNINEQSHEEDQTIPKKHKAVFSKFEKAAKRAVTVQSVATETADDAGQVEKAEEELHGKPSGPTSRAQS